MGQNGPSLVTNWNKMIHIVANGDKMASYYDTKTVKLIGNGGGYININIITLDLAAKWIKSFFAESTNNGSKSK